MKISHWMLVGLVTLSAGCSNTEVAQSPDQGASLATGSQYLTETEPAGAVAVGEARQSVAGEQAITLVGTIGGSSEPFVDGLAAFTIVDTKVPCCGVDEGCPTPWDYCCTQDQVKDNIATVKIVDEAGRTVADDARKLLGVKELSTVVVEGNALRDDQGNLTIAATHIFVRPSE